MDGSKEPLQQGKTNIENAIISTAIIYGYWHYSFFFFWSVYFVSAFKTQRRQCAQCPYKLVKSSVVIVKYFEYHQSLK